MTPAAAARYPASASLVSPAITSSRRIRRNLAGSSNAGLWADRSKV